MDQIILYCQLQLTSLWFPHIKLPVLNEKWVRHLKSTLGLWCYRTFELDSLQDQPTPNRGIGVQLVLCSLTFTLISFPNRHPLWPDHTSPNVDSSAGSLAFSLTLNHAVTTSDRDHIQPRLAANCPQLHFGFTTQQRLRYPSVFINSYDCICSMKGSEISISLEGQQRRGWRANWILTACSKLALFFAVWLWPDCHKTQCGQLFRYGSGRNDKSRPVFDSLFLAEHMSG